MSSIEQIKSMYKYINVTVDKQFALELIPIVELIITDISSIKKITISELPFFERIYVKHCNKKEIYTKLYEKIIEKNINKTRYKILSLLDVLYDIVQEGNPSWNTRWKIKPYCKVKYDEVKTTLFGIESFVLKPKPGYEKKVKQNEKIEKHNKKSIKMCQKWRDSKLRFYKKILKIINN